MTEALLTAAEAAERLRVSARTLNRLHQRRALPYLRLGRQVRFPAAALDAWLQTLIIYPETGKPRQEEPACTKNEGRPTGGSPTATPAGARLSNLLKLPTAAKPH